MSDERFSQGLKESIKSFLQKDIIDAPQRLALSELKCEFSLMESLLSQISTEAEGAPTTVSAGLAVSVSKMEMERKPPLRPKNMCRMM